MHATATGRKQIVDRWLEARAAISTESLLACDPHEQAARMREERSRREDVLERVLVGFSRSRVWGWRCHWQGSITREDADQVALLAAWESLDTYEPLKGALTTWAAWRILYRLQQAARHARRLARGEVPLVEDWTGDTALAVEPEEINDPVGWLRLAKCQLTLPQLQVVNLWQAGKSNVEIAEALGLKTPAVSARLQTAIRKMRAYARRHGHWPAELKGPKR